MAPTFMVPCPACGCHAKAHESECPHCGEPLRRSDGTIPRTAAAILLGLTAVTAANCGSGGGTGGMGGGSSATIVTSTHYGFGPTYMPQSGYSSSGGDPCATGADCTQCADFNTCAMCEQGNHPEGSMVFNDLITCVYCTACYTVCDGSTAGCTAAPTTMDACDGAMPDPMGPGCIDSTNTPATGCIPCAEAATCKPKVDACKADTDCVAFNQALQNCPTN
jgi:hypothetical protein